MVYIDIYYNSKSGYLIASDVKVKNSIIHIVPEPVISLNSQAEKFELANYIDEAFKKSENSELADRSQVGNYRFWEISGIKSFSAFSKKFKAVEIKKEANTYEIVVMIREKNGSYVPSKEKKDHIILDVNNNLELLAEKVMDIMK